MMKFYVRIPIAEQRVSDPRQRSISPDRPEASGCIRFVHRRREIVYITLVFNALLKFHKPGQEEREPCSYRPISKVFERLIAAQVVRILESQGINPEDHFGFLADYGTVEKPNRAVEQIRTSSDSKKYCIGLCLDIQSV